MEKYIKANTVLKFINSCLEHEDKITDTEKAVLTGVKTCIERIPAADVVEVRHGRWEFTEDVDMPWCTKAVCTSCGVPIADNIDLSQSFGRKRFIRYNRYCPDCGAKMDEEEL